MPWRSECGRLPFALALCGAMARDGAPWADLLDALAEADLAFLRKQFPNYPYPDVLRARSRSAWTRSRPVTRHGRSTTGSWPSSRPTRPCPKLRSCNYGCTRTG